MICKDNRQWVELLLSRNQCFCVKTKNIELNF